MHVFYISIFIVFVVCFGFLFLNGGLFIFNIKLCFVCFTIIVIYLFIVLY